MSEFDIPDPPPRDLLTDTEFSQARARSRLGFPCVTEFDRWKRTVAGIMVRKGIRDDIPQGEAAGMTLLGDDARQRRENRERIERAARSAEDQRRARAKTAKRKRKAERRANRVPVEAPFPGGRFPKRPARAAEIVNVKGYDGTEPVPYAKDTPESPLVLTSEGAAQLEDEMRQRRGMNVRTLDGLAAENRPYAQALIDVLGMAEQEAARCVATFAYAFASGRGHSVPFAIKAAMGHLLRVARIDSRTHSEIVARVDSVGGGDAEPSGHGDNIDMTAERGIGGNVPEPVRIDTPPEAEFDAAFAHLTDLTPAMRAALRFWLYRAPNGDKEYAPSAASTKALVRRDIIRLADGVYVLSEGAMPKETE